jgi:hypothetical protein
MRTTRPMTSAARSKRSSHNASPRSITRVAPSSASPATNSRPARSRRSRG